MTRFGVTIDMDSKCKRCGKGGAANGGFCTKCILKNLKAGKYDKILNSTKGSILEKVEKTCKER